MTELSTYERTAPRPSFGEMLGFYAYMVAVGGGVPDRRVFSTVVQRPELVGEITRPETELEEEDGEGEAA